jgi:hypothetical protein
MTTEPFRVQFILRDGLSSIQAVPVVSRDQLPAEPVRAGMLSGASELLAFARATGLDSVVRTRTLSDNPPKLLREFLVDTPESIVSSLEARHRAESEAVDKLLDGEKLSEADNVALSPLEHFVLGASSLSCAEGLRRSREWFEERDAKKRA